MSLHKKIFHGALWSLVERGGQQAVSLLVFMVLARLIGPEEYGLANICFIYFLLGVLVFNSLVDGVVSLQLKDDVHLSSLFWLVIGSGLLLSLLCFLSAPFMADFLNLPRLKGLIYGFSIIPFLMSSAALPNILIQKNMNYKVYAIRTLTATILGGMVGIYMAYDGYGAFAIIGQQITLYVIINCIVWYSIEWRPRFLFSTAALLRTIKPGLGSMGMNSLIFFDEQAPRLIAGKFVGATALGYYALATRLQNGIHEMLVSPPLTVLFPAFSSIKDNTEQQRKISAQILLISCSILWPILSLAIATAHVYVPLLFGQKWIPAELVMQILFAGLIAAPMTLLVRQIFRSHGKLSIYFRIKVVASILNAVALLLLTLPNGLIYFVIATVCISFIFQPVSVLLLEKSLGIYLASAVLPLIKPFVGALIGGAAAYIASEVFNGWAWNPWLSFLLDLLIGGITCLLVYFLLLKNELQQTLAQIRKIRAH